MADEVLTSPPKRPVPEIKAPERPAATKFTNQGDQIFREPVQPPSFIPPKTPEEVVSTEVQRGPGLLVTKPGEEPIFHPSQRQQAVEPRQDIPQRPDTGKPVQKFPTRDEFEKFAFEAIGGNPFEFDPAVEVQHATQDLRPLFNQVFGNRVYWGDRDRLDPQQQKFWDDTVKAYRAQIFNSASNLRKQRIEVYNHMLSKYSDEVHEQKAAESAVATQNAAILAAAKERRIRVEKEAKVKVEARKEERAEERLDLAKKRFEAYEKNIKVEGEEGPSRSDIQSIAKAESMVFDGVRKITDGEMNFIGGLQPGDRLDPVKLQEFNRSREAVGLPQLLEIKTTEEADQSTWDKIKEFIPFVGETLPENVDIYTYIEETEELPEGTEVSEEPPVEPISDTLIEFDAAVREQHPDAIKVADKWYIQQDGKVFEIVMDEE